MLFDDDEENLRENVPPRQILTLSLSLSLSLSLFLFLFLSAFFSCLSSSHPQSLLFSPFLSFLFVPPSLFLSNSLIPFASWSEFVFYTSPAGLSIYCKWLPWISRLHVRVFPLDQFYASSCMVYMFPSLYSSHWSNFCPGATSHEATIDMHQHFHLGAFCRWFFFILSHMAAITYDTWGYVQLAQQKLIQIVLADSQSTFSNIQACK